MIYAVLFQGEVNAELAYRVGRVFAAMFAAETAVVGHDYPPDGAGACQCRCRWPA